MRDEGERCVRMGEESADGVTLAEGVSGKSSLSGDDSRIWCMSAKCGLATNSSLNGARRTCRRMDSDSADWSVATEQVIGTSGESRRLPTEPLSRPQFT